MAKNYILEPTVLPNDGNEGEFYLSFEEIPFDLNSLNESVSCEVSDGTILKYAGFDDSDGEGAYYFTTNGQWERIEPWVSIYDADYDAEDEKFIMYNNRLCDDSSVTVSIYTGEDDPEPAPSSNDISRNFAFSDHSRNDMDGIADIMDDLLGLNKKEPDPVTPDDEGGDTPDSDDDDQGGGEK